MWMILIALLAGLLIGRFNILPDFISRYMNGITTASLIALLLLIGAKIGMDREMISHLTTLGTQSFLLALSTIIFSLLCLYLMTKILGWEDEMKIVENGSESDEPHHSC